MKNSIEKHATPIIITLSTVIFIEVVAILVLIFAFVLKEEPAVEAQANARAAVVEDLEGYVIATTGGSDMNAFKGLALLYEDAVGTGVESWTCLELSAERFVLVEENSNVLVSEMAESPGNTEVMLNDGKIWVIILSELGEDENFEVITPTGSMAVRGTVFAVEADINSSRIAVYDGTVSVSAGDEILDATLEAVEISSSGSATDVNRTELTAEDMTPLVLYGEDGPGGVFTKLRGLLQEEEIGYITIRGEQYSIKSTRLMLNNMDLTDTDIEPLIYMTKLVYLRLDYNQITDISPLSVMENLSEANLGNNQIIDIEPLRGLTKLTQLYLNDNDIEDWSPVDHVPSVFGRP